MPIYQYQCQHCGHAFETLQPFSAGPLQRCPKCQGPLRRVIQPVGVIFKGPGWYSTDHRPTRGNSITQSTDAPSGKSDGETAGATPKATTNGE